MVLGKTLIMSKENYYIAISKDGSYMSTEFTFHDFGEEEDKIFPPKVMNRDQVSILYEIANKQKWSAYPTYLIPVNKNGDLKNRNTEFLQTKDLLDAKK